MPLHHPLYSDSTDKACPLELLLISAQNTWMGDPIRALQAAKQIEIIQKHDLVSHTASIGAELYKDLEALADGKASGKMLNLRGKSQGTFIAWDMPSPGDRDAFLREMRKRGINMAGVSHSPAATFSGGMGTDRMLIR
jgi:4-aminobutyrate aminotransferase-like enzyme